jgi:hypothetical protein
MRIVGIQWLAHRFYPKAYAVDMPRELRYFHRLFLGIDLSAGDIEQWLK